MPSPHRSIEKGIPILPGILTVTAQLPEKPEGRISLLLFQRSVLTAMTLTPCGHRLVVKRPMKLGVSSGKD
jgi:hypothetical protein